MSNTFPNASAAWHNRYLLMRHGHSEANRQGLIISSPERGLAGYGLSSHGQRQLDELVADWRWATPTRIVHSDFLRTTETARRIASRFRLPLQAEPRLRERFFGAFEGGDVSRYAQVWALDEQDPAHRHHGVEAVTEVARRMRAVIDDLERDHRNETLLLVSHGDPLQILLASLEGRELSRHRERATLAPASVTAL